MPSAAGYAAVIALGQSTMRSLVRVLYITNKIKHVLPLNVPLPFGLGALTGELFIGVPTLRFLDRGDDRMTLDIHAWGKVTAAGLPLLVELNGVVSVPASVTFASVDGAPVLQFGIAGSAATLDEVTFNTDPELPAVVADQLTPDAVKGLLEPVLQAQLAGQSAASLDLSFLGGLNRATQSATVRVRAGVLLIGIDVTWPTLVVYPVAPVTSHGDVSALADVRRGGDVALFVAGEQVPMVFSDVAAKIRNLVAEKNATLDALDLAPTAGALHVHAKAHDGDGSTEFSFDVIPVLTTDRDERKERVTFQTANIGVDVNPSLANKFKAAFGSLITLGWAGIYAQDLADTLRASISYDISQGGTDAGARVTWFTLPGTKNPPLKLRVDDYTIAAAGSRVSLSITALLGKPRLLGVTRYWADTEAHLQTFYTIAYPPDVLADDPQLTVSWALRRTDTGDTVDTATGHRYRADVTLPGLTVPPAVPGRSTPLPLAVDCTVTRTLATSTETIFQATQPLYDPNLIDRSHPYVSWVRGSVVPVVTKEADGSLTADGLTTVQRQSKIHRTDVPGGCLFVTPQGKSSGPPTYTYFDALPFPVADIGRHRHLLCDYCFFGGPTNTQALPLP
jgi:hypothetical protein